MKISLFLILIFISISTISQTFEVYNKDTINRTDANNLKQGYWIRFDNAKTAKIEEGKYIDNKKNGVWKKYYSSGIKKQEITYKNNKPDGYAKFYYESGQVSEEGLWKTNKWVGEYKFYFENGNLSYEWNYNKNGKRTGEQKYYHENGNLMIEGEWTEGKESGVIKEYYENGSLKNEKKYQDGIFDATTLKHYEKETKPAVTTGSKSQQQVGVFDGNGYHKTYNSKKLIDREGVFKGGKFMDGKRYYYDTAGNLTKTEIYRNGQVINVIYNK